MPKFTYNIMPETLQEFIEGHPCQETRMLIDELISAIDRVERDADISGEGDYSKGIAHAVEYIQAAMEDYLAFRALHERMKFHPQPNVERN